MSKSGRWCHSAKQSSTHSAGASADTVGPSEGIFNQPCGQACNPDPRLSGLLQPVRAFLKAHMAKRSEPWGSADLRCSVTDPQGMAEEIRQQQQQSFKHLLERQKL